MHLEVHTQHTTEYDEEGRISVIAHSNSDGSKWIQYFSYDSSGRLLKTASGVEGQMKQTSYLYDHVGRLQSIRDVSKADATTTFNYDEHGRKTKIEICRPEDYRPNVAVAGSPFEAADRAPNILGGGTATTTYDEHDRATEVKIRNAEGELISRAIRTYDAEGRVAEEHQILDRVETLIPAEHRAKMMEESGLSANDLVQELRAQLTKLMSGESGPHTVSYRYDAQGRLIHTSRRIFNHQDEIETTYNEHGDIESEIERSTRSEGSTSFSEVRHSYTYDQHGNWTEKTSSHRSSPDAEFQLLPLLKRKLEYY